MLFTQTEVDYNHVIYN